MKKEKWDLGNNKETKICPLCRKDESTVDKNNPFLVDCQVCGKFELSKEAHCYIEKEYSDAEGDTVKTVEMGKKYSLLSGVIRELSGVIREYPEQRKTVKIENKEKIDELIQSDMVPQKISERMDKILLFLARKREQLLCNDCFSEVIINEEIDWPIGYCLPHVKSSTQSELFLILDEMSKKNYIELTGEGAPMRRYKILFAGLERIEELKESKQQGTEKKPEKSTECEVTEPEFDEQSGKLSFGNKHCKLRRKSMQHKLVKFLYNNPNEMHTYGEITIKIGLLKKMAYKSDLSEWMEKAEKFEDNDAQMKEIKAAVKRIDTNFQILTPIKKKIIDLVNKINKKLKIKKEDKQQLFECNNGYRIIRKITPNTSSKKHC